MPAPPIQLGRAQANGLPPTWKPPCPFGEHHLKMLERRNGSEAACDDSSDDDGDPANDGMLDANHPLFQAARQGNVGVLKLIFNDGHASACRRSAGPSREAGETDPNACDTDGCTALSWSARHGHVACIELLLGRGATVDATEKLGWTPLMEAAFGNHPAAVRTLLAARANPRLENRQFESALAQAREVHSEACIALLCDALSDAEVLLDACKSGDVRRLREALGAGATLAQVEHLLTHRQNHHCERSTALHWACANGHAACVHELIEHGAPPDAAHAPSGWTPLMAAVANHETGAVTELLAARADPMRQSTSGHSALSAARGRRGNPCLSLLEAAVAEAAAAVHDHGSMLSVSVVRRVPRGAVDALRRRLSRPRLR